MSDSDAAGSAIELGVQAALDQSGYEYELIACKPELADTAAFCDHYGYPPEQSANTIVVASRRPPGTFVAAVVLAPTRLDVNNRVRKLMGVRKASFAPAEATAEVTGMRIGGVTPFALPDDMAVYIDARVMEQPWIILGGGSRSLKIKIDPSALAALPSAAVIEDLATEPPPR